MTYRILADGVVVVHLAFVLFVVGGGFLLWRWRRLVWVHLPAAIWGAWIEFAGWICPLTPLENWLRNRGGLEGYEGGFIERYLLPVLYPTDLTRLSQIALGLGVILINLIAYVGFWKRARRRKSPTADSP